MSINVELVTRRDLLILSSMAGLIWLFGTEAVKADSEPFLSAFEDFGIDFGYKIGTKTTEITVKADRAKFIAAVPKMKAIQLMNDELSQTYINLHQNFLTGIFLMRFTPSLLNELYQGKSEIDKSNIKGVMAVVDDYGSEKIHDVFSCKFDRVLWKRINWDHFQDVNFPKIAPQFRFSPWYMLQNEGDN